MLIPAVIKFDFQQIKSVAVQLSFALEGLQLQTHP